MTRLDPVAAAGLREVHWSGRGPEGLDVVAVEDWPLAVEVLCIRGRSVPASVSCENPDPTACAGCSGPCDYEEE